jgi:DNA-binding transcriptional ArsR family regulator
MQKTFKALADPTRRKVLQLLRERDMTAGEIAEHFDSSKPTLSRHFSVLHSRYQEWLNDHLPLKCDRSRRSDVSHDAVVQYTFGRNER